MDVQHLVHQANRIAEFFQAMPDTQEGIDGVAQHIKKFWEPRMRIALLQAVQSQSASDLHPLVHSALTQHREMLEPNRS